MKDPLKLQRKLYEILVHSAGLRLNTPPPPWDDVKFREMAWVVDNYVRESGEVVNDDPLQAWLEEYQFYLTQNQ